MGNPLETHGFLGWKHEATGASGGNLIGRMNSMAHGKCFLFLEPQFPARKLGNFWGGQGNQEETPRKPSIITRLSACDGGTDPCPMRVFPTPGVASPVMT